MLLISVPAVWDKGVWKFNSFNWEPFKYLGFLSLLSSESPEITATLWVSWLKKDFTYILLYCNTCNLYGNGMLTLVAWRDQGCQGRRPVEAQDALLKGYLLKLTNSFMNPLVCLFVVVFIGHVHSIRITSSAALLTMQRIIAVLHVVFCTMLCRGNWEHRNVVL